MPLFLTKLLERITGSFVTSVGPRNYAKYKALDIPEKTESDFEYPDTPSKCLWIQDKKIQPPNIHISRPLAERPKILPNILDAIGMTPMVKLNKIPQSMDIQCKMFAKCEFLNPGGSLKDRIGYRMVIDAEKKGYLRPGYTVIEPTSGNTGIGVALACAVRGYRCIVVVPDKNSDEKMNILNALGAETIKTRTEARFDEPDSLIAVAQRLQKEVPNAVILNQYKNCSNPLAHYDGTGSEILEQLDYKVDMVVVGGGTGGTLTGIGRKIKEELPNCKIIGVDPIGSILAEPEELNSAGILVNEVEGLGYDFVPTVLDRKVVDKWYKSNDKDSFTMARRLIREEGLLCGGSSGATMHAALEAAKDLTKDQTCVVIFPDNIRNYMSKFLEDCWMEERFYKDSVNEHGHSWWNCKLLGTTMVQTNLPFTINHNVTCREAVEEMKFREKDQIAIIDCHGHLKGLATVDNIMRKILDKSLKFSDPITKGMVTKFIRIDTEATLGKLSRILEKSPYVAVIEKQDICIEGEVKTIDSVIAILTQKNMLNFLSRTSFSSFDF